MLFGTGIPVTSAQIPIVRAGPFAKPNIHRAEKYTLLTLVEGSSAPQSKSVDVSLETMIWLPPAPTNFFNNFSSWFTSGHNRSDE